MPTTRVLTFGCVHAQHHDPAAIEWLLARIKEYRPHTIVHLGDQMEAIAASKWADAKESTVTLEEEFRISDRILGAIRKTAPRGCSLVFLPGNHDANLEAIDRVPKLLRTLTTWRTPHTLPGGEVVNRELPTHWRVPCEYLYCRKRGVFRVGQVTFAHGFECGLSSDETQSIKLGNPSGLFISAHTHRPLSVTQALRTKRTPLPYWYANVGCLRHMKPDYMARKDTSLWGQACLTVEIDPRGRPGGPRRWDAHLHLFRMYGETP